jgi:hypothetical protein
LCEAFTECEADERLFESVVLKRISSQDVDSAQYLSLARRPQPLFSDGMPAGAAAVLVMR